jgi:hypothetical protein
LFESGEHFQKNILRQVFLGNPPGQVGANNADNQRIQVVDQFACRDLVTAAQLQHRLGESACDGGGRTSYMAAIELRCTSLDAVRESLRALPARGVHDQGSRVIVAASLACNTTIEFIE